MAMNPTTQANPTPQSALADYQAASQRTRDILAQEQKAQKPAIEQVRTAMAAPSGVEQFTSQLAPIPAYHPKPLLDPQSYHNFFNMAVAFAAVTGLAGHSALSAMNSLSGSLQGYMAGRKEMADEDFKNYQIEMQNALATNQELIQKANIALKQHQGNVQDALNNLKLVGLEYHDQILASMADQKNFAGAIQHLVSLQTAGQKLGLEAATLDEKIRHDRAMEAKQPKGTTDKLATNKTYMALKQSDQLLNQMIDIAKHYQSGDFKMPTGVSGTLANVGAHLPEGGFGLSHIGGYTDQDLAKAREFQQLKSNLETYLAESGGTSYLSRTRLDMVNRQIDAGIEQNNPQMLMDALQTMKSVVQNGLNIMQGDSGNQFAGYSVEPMQ